MTASDGPERRVSWRVLEPHVLSDARLLGVRLRQLARVRLLLALAIVLGATFARHVLDIAGLDVGTLVGTAFAVVGYDLLTWLVASRFGGRTDDPEAVRVVAWTTYGAIVLDYLALTIVVWQAGGARSPFLSFFLLHAIVSGVMLGKWPALTLHGLAYALMSGIVVADWTGVAPPPPLPAGTIEVVGPIDGRYALAVILSYGLLFALTAFILTSFSASIRRSERSLHEANAELTRLSEMRRDFLDIALHNLQSPVGAVRMHVGNVLAGHGGPVTDAQRQWLERSLERLERLSEFMRALSILSSLESIRIEERAAPVDVGAMLGEIVRDHQDAAQQRGVALTLEEPVPPARVRGVDVLLREAVVNYVTNALKYTPSGGHVTARVATDADRVRISVTDDGPGIAPEDQKRLFTEFVRIREKGKPVAKVQGSGLGLTIVRRIALVHGGTTGLASEPGKGSTFWLDLPLE
jgi:signal transduction histidine kinase